MAQLTPNDIANLRAQLDLDDREQVAQDLWVTRLYGDPQNNAEARVVELWLEEQEVARGDARHTDVLDAGNEANRIAEEANDIAKEANRFARWAAAGAIGAFVMSALALAKSMEWI